MSAAVVPVEEAVLSAEGGPAPSRARQLRPYAIAALAAILIQPAFLFAWTLPFWIADAFSLKAALVVSGFVLLFAAPVFLVLFPVAYYGLRHSGDDDREVVAVVGALVAGLPYGVLSLIPLFGVILGLHGLFGALVFDWVWRKVDARDEART